MPKEETAIDPIAELSKKLDALSEIVKGLVPKTDSTPKVDPLIEKAEKALRSLLKPRVDKEASAKLDAMGLTELSIVAEILPLAKVEVGNDITQQKTDANSIIDDAKKVRFNK